MITFLPFEDFHHSARSLDMRRLGKQRAEVKQLVHGRIVSDMTTRHPASRMWCRHLPALIDYGIAICHEWRARGYDDTVLDWLRQTRDDHFKGVVATIPPWLGIPAFHSSHRSRLVAKDSYHYRDTLGWSDDPEQPYLWPLIAQPGQIVFRIGATQSTLSMNWWGNIHWDCNPINSGPMLIRGTHSGKPSTPIANFGIMESGDSGESTTETSN